jgi:hypothetical protein
MCQRPPPCGDPAFGFLFEDSGFVVPSGYVGAYPEVGEQPVAWARVRGHRGGLFQCPPGASPHRDGLVLRWRERGTVVAVSVTGHVAAHRRLVLALAAHLELVLPGG